MKSKQPFQKLFLLFSVVALVYGIELQAQVQWSEYPGNPVMDFGASGSWDEGVVFLPFVIKSGDTLKMWYAGAAQSQIFTNPEIGYAWSLDGINWTRLATNPVLPHIVGEWDDGQTSDAIVLQDGDTLRMWYNGSPATAPSGPNEGAIGYATSIDGINWNRLSAPVLQRGSAGEWDADLISPGKVIKEGNIFKMWYSGGTGEFPSASRISTGYATSTDGINWTKYDDPTTTAAPFQFSDPVLPRGDAGSFDEFRAWTPRVLSTALGYEMWYAGESPLFEEMQLIMYATSTDGINWTKYAGNPVLQAPGTWANDILGPSVILDGNQYRMWFTGFQPGFPFAGRIGYATAPLVVSVDEKNILPSQFSLGQNYPNPFNPTTTITYQLPASGQVTLKIFNSLGEEVETLLNEYQQAGFYNVQFTMYNAQLSSGIYFYQLKVYPANSGASSFIQTKKMILLK